MGAQVFGSPLRLFQTSKELFNNIFWEKQVKEWVSVLHDENEQLKKDAHPEMGLVITEGAAVAFIASKKLKLPTNVKYLAVDIYHRFCILHIESLTKTVKNEATKGGSDVITIDSVQQKVGKQAPLRVLTCLRIASKLTCHNKALSANCIKKLLKDMGHDFSLNAVNKSETRILNEIHFRCRYASSPLEYLGVLVAYIGTVESGSNGSHGSVVFELLLDDLYKTSIHLLDSTFLKYDQIYKELYYTITGAKVVDKTFRLAVATVLSDRMLLVCSVLASAGWVLGGERLSQLVTSKLVQASNIPEEDISMLASCIIKEVIENNERSFEDSI